MPSRRMSIALGLAAALLLGAVAFAATRIGGLQGTVERGTDARGPAPGFTGIAEWLNTDAPLTLQELRGKVVLVDFWTYSCINCIRTFPHLRALHDRYRTAGLRIIGVHSPEFDFERDPVNVADAIARYELPYPVALDNDMATWRAYRNHYWPHVYLIDAEGRIRFDHIGEGGEEQIQDAIRDLLAETGARLPSPLDFRDTGPSAHITPEVYAGSERGGRYLGNPEGYRSGVTDYAPVQRTTINDAGADGTFFLEGPWVAEGESVRATADGARIILPFFARDVFMVAEGGRARVLLDHAPIDASVAGADVTDGVARLRRSDLFRLVRLDAPERHVLTLEVSEGFELYTFTFG